MLLRAVDRALDMVKASAEGEGALTLILDYTDAFNQISLYPAEVRFCLGDEGFAVFHGMGFGGRVFPLVFSRIGSWLHAPRRRSLRPETPGSSST